jgi:hypothetical protein
MAGEGMDASVLDLSPEKDADPAWPYPFEPPPYLGPPDPELALSEDVDDPRMPWLLRK